MIRIPRGVLDEAVRHVQSVYPEEGCGLLVGLVEAGVKSILKAIPAENVYQGPRRSRYSIDPLEYMRIENREAANGHSVLAVFHSHPDAPARPSLYDLEHAVPTLSYLIISISGGSVREIAAWQVDEVTGQFEQERLEIV